MKSQKTAYTLAIAVLTTLACTAEDLRDAPSEAPVFFYPERLPAHVAAVNNQTNNTAWNSAVVISNIHANGMLCWQLGLTETNRTASAKPSETKPDQVLEIAHLSPTFVEPAEADRFSRLGVWLSGPQPHWKDWFRPGRFPARWLERWSTEPTEGFVVLISARF